MRARDPLKNLLEQQAIERRLAYLEELSRLVENLLHPPVGTKIVEWKPLPEEDAR